MRQESTKEPVVALVGRFLCRGSFVKKGKRRRMRASSPRSSFSPFSVCFANPRSVAPRTAALVSCASMTPFFLRKKRAGGGTPAAAGAIVWKPARFTEAKRRSPEGATTQAVGRPDRATRDRIREADRKRDGTTIDKLACHIGVTASFSYSLP